ncbi:MAG: hypothetical protein LBP32_08675 [Spirochaetaceae bacterium]|jgi:hypothetical protein|nr:hypothetical protein [Spirochaetaceae bacterium]
MRIVLFLLCLGGVLSGSGAQEKPGVPYLIPQTVFVGDMGRLVVPLGFSRGPLENTVVDEPELLSGSADLVISRVALENRENGVNLLIDFQSYVPGTIKLPPVKIASLEVTGLEFTVSSILASGEGLVLSGPETALTAPGTIPIIYGAILGLILILFLAVLAGLWSGRGFKRFRERFRRRRLIRSMGRTLKRLRTGLLKNRDRGAEETVTILARELRSFVGFLTAMNCQAMVPGEFLTLPPLADLPGAEDLLSGNFLCDIFRRCDSLRFSGTGIERREVLEMVEDVRKLVGVLDRAEREAPARGSAA